MKIERLEKRIRHLEEEVQNVRTFMRWFDAFRIPHGILDDVLHEIEDELADARNLLHVLEKGDE